MVSRGLDVNNEIFSIQQKHDSPITALPLMQVENAKILTNKCLYFIYRDIYDLIFSKNSSCLRDIYLAYTAHTLNASRFSSHVKNKKLEHQYYNMFI